MPKNSYVHFGTVGYDLGSVVMLFQYEEVEPLYGIPSRRLETRE